jgi:predicted dehydrogenase
MVPSIGVVGCGGISNFHFDGFAANRTAVAAVSDLDRATAAAKGARFGATVHGTWQELVADAAVNTVLICGPTPMHEAVASAAIAAGKHVICEKTLTNSPAASRALAEAAAQRGTQLYTGYMKRFFPAVQQAKALIPALGRITSVHIRAHHGVPGDFFTGAVHPFFAPAANGQSPIKGMAGGGALTAAGSHLLDLLLHLVGQPSTAQGRSFVRPGMDVEIAYHGLLGYAVGGTAHLDCTWHPLTRIGVNRSGFDERFEIHGVNGVLALTTPIWNQPTATPCTLRHYDEAAGTWTEHQTQPMCPFAAAGKHFTGCIASGTQDPAFDRLVGYRVDRLIASLGEAAASAREVAIAW